MKILLYIVTLITSLSIHAFELKFDCGGKFETLKTMTFSDNSKYFDFKSEGTCTDNLGNYNSYLCFGLFETKSDNIIRNSFICESTYQDLNKTWLRVERNKNTERSASVGKQIIVDATGRWEALIGVECSYGIKTLDHNQKISFSFSSHKCIISEEQKVAISN